PERPDVSTPHRPFLAFENSITFRKIHNFSHYVPPRMMTVRHGKSCLQKNRRTVRLAGPNGCGSAAGQKRERKMGDVYPTVRVAAVQAAPVFLDREASIEKACRLIREAGEGGAKVIGFPEGFIPGHPLWYHFHPATTSESRRMAAELFKNSVEIPSAATDALCAAARDAGAYVVMGLCEKMPGTFGTMYNSQLFISPQGKIIGKHQKLVPTSGE